MNEENNGSSSSKDSVVAMTKLFAQQNLHTVQSDVINQVSPQDRETSLYDVHGVLTPIEETPEFLEEKLTALSSHLSAQPNRSNKSTADSAAENNTSVFQNVWDKIQHEAPEFTRRCMLSCLRADGFHVETAAARFVRHLNAKRRWFGADAVTKELGMSDLGGGLERRVLEAGAVQVLRNRDRSGRAILANFSGIARNHTLEALVKVTLCLGTMEARDEQVQKRGFVYIVCSFRNGAPVFERTPALVQLLSCLPIRISAFHFCSTDISRCDQVSDATLMFDTPLLCRFNSHFGSGTEIRHNLMTFGIPLDALPIRDDETIDFQFHNEWIARRLDEEQGDEEDNDDAKKHNRKTMMISQPAGPLDIIMGRGLRGRKNPGNLLLKRLLEEQFGDYDSAGRNHKAAIASNIYWILRNKGYRFLSPAPGAAAAATAAVDADDNSNNNNLTMINEWIEMEEKDALDRISHGFRNLRMTLLKK